MQLFLSILIIVTALNVLGLAILCRPHAKGSDRLVLVLSVVIALAWLGYGIGRLVA
jgi:hypothetical protein